LKEIFEDYFIQEDRVTFSENKGRGVAISEAQQTLSMQLKQFYPKRCLSLHGVTSSGKKNIYTLLKNIHYWKTSVVFVT
jgi:primosomal protein N' (replication factor Y)